MLSRAKPASQPRHFGKLSRFVKSPGVLHTHAHFLPSYWMRFSFEEGLGRAARLRIFRKCPDRGGSGSRSLKVSAALRLTSCKSSEQLQQRRRRALAMRISNSWNIPSIYRARQRHPESALADQGGKSSSLVSQLEKTDNLLEAHPAVPENLHDCR